jgi:hypothetical protein
VDTEKNKSQTKTNSHVLTRTKVDFKTAVRRANFTIEEEKVVRMRKGISEERKNNLEMKGQNIPEIKAKLAFIEKALLDEMRGINPPEAKSTKERIIERLKRM